jgi:hypothetical protein
MVVTAKQIGLSLTVGIGVIIALMVAANAGISGEIVSKLLFPGMVVASALGFGAHDIGTVVAIFVTGSLLFGAAALLLSVLWSAKKIVSR